MSIILPSSASSNTVAAVAAASGGGAPSVVLPPPKAVADSVPTLMRLAAAAYAVNWKPSRSLRGIPSELCQAIWNEIKGEHARREGGPEPVSCAAMYPFIQHAWCIEALDLSDAGQWLADGALPALSYLPSLTNVRLLACGFVSDHGVAFAAQLPRLSTLDLSWTAVTDAAVASTIARCSSLTSLNLTGLRGVSDTGVSSLLCLGKLERLSLACTSISDAALDYLTYYSRFPDAAATAGHALGLHGLRWLELSNTRLSDTGVGKLVAVVEDGVAYGKVLKQLEYLALSMTDGVTPSAIRQVRVKYGFDTPLPNAQRTLAKSNTVALAAREWVIRFLPKGDKGMPKPTRSWEQARVVNYVAQYSKEMAEAAKVIERLGAADLAKRQRTG